MVDMRTYTAENIILIFWNEIYEAFHHETGMELNEDL